MYNRSISSWILLKYYYCESHLIYKLRYYRQTIFNHLNIVLPYVDIIGIRDGTEGYDF